MDAAWFDPSFGGFLALTPLLGDSVGAWGRRHPASPLSPSPKPPLNNRSGFLTITGRASGLRAGENPARIIGAPLADSAVETITTGAGLESLAAEWDGLVRAMPRPSPFLLHGWLAEWWRSFGDGNQLTVVTARRDGQLVGAVPAFIRRSGIVRVARFLGAHESALADVMLGAGESATTGRALVDELGRQPFDYADLFGLPID